MIHCLALMLLSVFALSTNGAGGTLPKADRAIPRVAMMYKDTALPMQAAYEQADMPSTERKEALFRAILNSGVALPYVPLRSTITIVFTDGVFAEANLEDMLLHSDGSERFDSAREIRMTNAEGAVAAYCFTLEPNIAAMLSSNSKDFEAGNTIRGLLLTCRNESTEICYAFVCRTDAGW